jgi:hypothetical protein
LCAFILEIIVMSYFDHVLSFFFFHMCSSKLLFSAVPPSVSYTTVWPLV